MNPQAVELVAEKLDEEPPVLPTRDGDAPAAFAELLLGLGADGSTARTGLTAVLDWIEALLPDFVLLAGLADGYRQGFSPYLDPGGVDAALAGPLPPPASRRVEPLDEFADVVATAWGPGVRRAAATTAGSFATDAARIELEHTLLMLAALYSIPIHGTTLPMTPEVSHRFLSDVALALKALDARVVRAVQPVRIADAYAAIHRHVDWRVQELGALHARLEPSATGPREPPPMVPIGCNKHVGALLEGRAWHKELEDELGSIVVTAHHFKGSAAAQAGITTPWNEPLDVDQTGHMTTLTRILALVPGWISEAFAVAGARPGAIEELSLAVRRIGVALKATQVLLGSVVVTEGLMRDPEHSDPQLWVSIHPNQQVLQNALEALEIGEWKLEAVERMVEENAAAIAILVTSYRWAQVIRGAMDRANEVLGLIDGAAGLAGAYASLLKSPPTSGAAAALSTGAAVPLTKAEVAQIAEGATIMLMGRNTRRSGGRASPKQGSEGEEDAAKRGKLPLNRPRHGFWSLLNPRKWRIPDWFLETMPDIVEVKNTVRLNLTSQLTDFMLYAQATERRLVLYVRASVYRNQAELMSGPLRDALEMLRKDGLIELRPLSRRFG